ncbi:MAG: hypothetical protein WDZ35_04380 [Crocinitomicaceae bacterium]
MNPYSGLFIQTISGILLIIGYYSLGWSFSHAALAYVFEIALLVVLGTVYFLFSSSKGQPGPIFISGGILVSIALFGTAFLAQQINEFPTVDYQFTENFKLYLKNTASESWFVWAIISIGAFVSFFSQKKNKRSSSYQQEMLSRILTIFCILIVNGAILYIFNSINKAIVLLSIIVLRILLELWMNPIRRLKKS